MKGDEKMLFYLWGVSQEEEEKKKLQDRIDDALKEIERLNNIINELDGYLDLKRKSYIEGFKWSGLEIIDQTKDFLQELKGSDKE